MTAANRQTLAARASFGLCILLVVLMSSGCGYRWTSQLDAGETRTVSLDTVENRTFPHRPGLEYDLTRRLKDEIATDRRLILTEGNARVRLRVSLTRLTEPTLVFDLDTGAPAELLLRASALVDARGEDFYGGRSRRTVTVSTSYTPGLGDSREDGLARLWRDLAREILDVAADTGWADSDESWGDRAWE
jgi:hypothetical protein